MGAADFGVEPMLVQAKPLGGSHFAMASASMKAR